MVALHIVRTAHTEGEKRLAEHQLAGIGEDPVHWPMMRLNLLDPWLESPGQWYEDAPGWLRILGEIARKGTSGNWGPGTPGDWGLGIAPDGKGTEHVTYDPCGRPAT